MDIGGRNRHSRTKRFKLHPACNSESIRRSSRTKGRAMARAVCETFESRLLLAAQLDGQIPMTIQVNSGVQTLLAPSDNLNTLTASSTTTAVSSGFQFVLNNAAAGQTTLFTTSLRSGSGADTAIALYDASGNRLVLQDTDSGTGGIGESLTIALQSGQKYTVEFYALNNNDGFFTTSSTETLDINPGPQATADTATINPSTGSGMLTTSNAPDSFTSSTNVQYFSMNFLDAGSSANVQVAAFGPDAAVDATLFLQTSSTAWQQISTSTLTSGGAPATLAVTPPSGLDITDGTYLLAVAPLNFTAAPEPVTITASTTSLLAPASTNPATIAGSIAESLTAIGTIGGTASATFSGGAAQLFSIVAPVTGPMTVIYSPQGAIKPLLSVYGPGGSSLVSVASQETNSATVTDAFNVTAGSTYYLSAGAISGATTGTFQLSASQPYASTAIAVGSTVGQTASVALTPGLGSQFYTFTPLVGSNYFALQISPDSGSTLTTQAQVIGSNQAEQTFTASGAGQPLTIVINENNNSGPYDVMVTDISGSGTATLKYIALTTPQQIAVNQFASTSVNLTTGALSSGPTAISAGQFTGLQYYEPSNSATGPTTYTAQTTGGASVILLHYVQTGSVLKLAGSSLSNSSGAAVLTDTAQTQEIHALAVLPLNFNSGTVQFSVAGPAPIGIGVSMIPNALPGTEPSTPPGNQSTFSVNGAMLRSTIQLDLYTTQLPANLTASISTFVFAPSDVNGPLQATVTVLSSTNTVLATGTNQPGQQLSLPLSGLTDSETLDFSVTPVAGSNLGSGAYSLSMVVNTSDPGPYLVNEPAFYPFVALGAQTPGLNYFPQNFSPTTLNYGSSASGDFTSNTPYNETGSGSIQIFEVSNIPLNTPFQIFTQDTTPTSGFPVNTNIKLFYLGKDSSNRTAYVPIPFTGPSFDYYPGNRSTIDADVVVNNTDIVPTMTETIEGEFFVQVPVPIYVVVMNEQGTLGNYTVSAMPTAGPVGGASAQDLVVAASSNSADLGGQQTLVTAANQSFNLLTPTDTASSAIGSLLVQTNSPTDGTGQSIAVTVATRTKFVNLVDFTSTGTIGSGGTLTLGMPASGTFRFGPGQTYVVTIVSTPLPSAGLSLTFSLPRSTAAPIPAATTSNIPPDGSSDSFQMTIPSPLGAISTSSAANTNGNFTRGFTVESEGTVTLNLTYPTDATNITVGLYQAGQQGTSGSKTSVGVLMDYVNTGTNGVYTMVDNLAPGTYVVIGSGTETIGFPNLKKIVLTGTIPAYATQVLNPDPTSGTTTLPEESVDNIGATADNGFSVPSGPYDPTFVYSRYATNYFDVTVPADTTGQPVSFTVSDPTIITDGAPTGAGTVSLIIYSLINGVYTQVGSGSVVNDSDPSGGNIDSGTVTATDTPVPGEQYVVAVSLNGYSTDAYVGVIIPVLSTGAPDLAVQPITLSPNNGTTLVQSSIVNESFTASPPVPYFLGLGENGSTRLLPALAPFGSVPFNLVWTPQFLGDAAGIVVDPNNTIAELSKTNNSAQTALSTVDPDSPTATIQLTDGHMTAEGDFDPSTGGTTWGRYISGAKGQTVTIEVVGEDFPDDDLYEVSLVGPNGSTSSPAFGANFTMVPGTGPVTAQTLSVTTDFGKLKATSSTNLNQIQFFAMDKYGLRTPTYVQNLDVIAAPDFLSGGLPGVTTEGVGGTITFDPVAHIFTYTFTDNLINDNDDFDDLVNEDPSQPLPVIGMSPDQFLIAINGNGSGGLDPTQNISFTVSAHILLEVAGAKILDKTYTGASAGNVTFNSQLILSGASLSMIPGSSSLSLQLSKEKLFSDDSPTIPIFSIGIPDVIGLNLGVKVGLEANLSAGVKLGPNPQDAGDSFLSSLGVMSPTFIEPSITGSASLVGQVKFAGFNLATITGTIGLTLSVTLGLDNSNPNAVFDFGDALDDLALDVDASLTASVAVKVPVIGTVYSLSETDDLGNIVNTVDHGIFLTDPPSTATGKFIAPGGDNPEVSAINLTSGTTPTIINGSSLVGAYPIDPTPQIVINNSVTSGMGLSAQLINTDTVNPNAPIANLAFTTRTGTTWSALNTLSENTDISNPVLALTNDASGTPGVVVYDADNVPGSPASQTIDQRLDAEDIRYRYFNGTSWGPEIGLTSDSLYDSDQSVAFNATGAGVLAYVHNTDSALIGSNGSMDASSNDIEASVWNPSTHTFGAPSAITSADGVDDSSPTTFVDTSGQQYVIWIRATTNSNELMYSIHNNSGWSTPAVLSISGLPTGGTFQNVAMGSDGTGRVNVIFSYSVNNADGSISTTLFERPATTAGFTTQLPAVQLATDSNFSSLRTTNAPTGALVAYWEQSDGQINQIFETTIMQGVATTPTQLTDDPNVAMEPSVAVDSNGVVQVLYDNDILFGGTSQGSPTDPTVGAPMTSGVASSSIQDLPQLTFTTGLSFPSTNQTSAASGTQVTGTAVIANRGLASTTVTISAYDGLPTGGTLVGTQSVFLLPGATYNVSQVFTVQAGLTTYSLQLSTTTGQAFDTTENLSSTTLSGLVDLGNVEIANDANGVSPGGSYILQATFANLSNIAAGPFAVTLYSGDPLSPQFPVTPLSTQNFTSLAGMTGGAAFFNVTLPSSAGADVYTVVVDSGAQLAESNETNNEGRYEVDFEADPAISDSEGTSAAVTATLLNSSNSNNVQVVVNAENLGVVTATNIPIDLEVSRNGDAFTSVGQIVIPSLDLSGPFTETFTFTALAGDNLYVASIDPSAFPQDSIRNDDIGSADLFVTGLPTLVAGASLSTNTTSPGAPLTLNATVNNTGLADITGVPVTVLAALSSGGPSFTLGSGTVDVNALGSISTAIPLNTTGLGAGQYTVTFEIDPGQTILQGSEAGNDATASLVISAPLALTGSIEYLRLDADGHTLDIWNSLTPTGSPTQQITLSAISALSLATVSGSQVDTIDFSMGDPLPAGGMIFTGPNGGANALNIVGTTGNDSVTVNGSTVTFSNATISAPIAYINAIAISFNGNGGTDTLTQSAQPGGGAGLALLNPNSSDTLTVNGGRFTFLATPAGSGITSVSLGTLNIGTGGSVAVSPPNGHANRTVLIANKLNMNGGTLDLSTNDLIVHSGSTGESAFTTIFSQIGAGRGSNGLWTGIGITSSAAASSPSNMALGVILNDTNASNFNPTTRATLSGSALKSIFDGQPVADGDVLIKYTFVGDTDLSGTVAAADYTQIDNAFSYNAANPTTPLTGWYNGDFNYDHALNGDDYTLIDNDFNTQGSISFAALPATLLATNTAQIAGTSSPVTVAMPDTAKVRQLAATVPNPVVSDNADAQKLKKRRTSSWEMLEG
jgi:CARDB